MCKSKISIVIPVYNSEKYLDRCLQSVILQDYKNIEIITVDDGSTDKSREKIKEYKTKDSRIKIILQKNAGPNAARRQGVIAATGDWIVFVDSDDSIDRKFCSKMLLSAKETSSEIVGCSMKVIDMFSNKEEIKCIDTKTYSGHEASLSMISTDKFWVYNHTLSFLGYLFPAKIIKSIFSEIDTNIILSEDVINMLLLLWDVKRVTFIPDPLYTAYFHRDSLTHSHTRDFYNSEVHLYKYGTKKMTAREMPKKSLKQLEFLIIQNMLFTQYSKAFGHLDTLYPYDGVEKGSKIVVYGAGEFGYELVRYIMKSEKYTLVGCIDKKSSMMNDNDFICKVYPPELIKAMCYDYVVIAATKPRIRNSIRADLHVLNIPINKIKDIDIKKINYKYLPASFFE